MARKRQVAGRFGRFGSAVATTLAELDCEVACVDLHERPVQRIAPLVTHAMSLDSTDRDALNQISVADFDVAVVAIGADIEASILTTANLAELGCTDIVAKAMTLPHARILEKVGAHRVCSRSTRWAPPRQLAGPHQPDRLHRARPRIRHRR